MWLQAEMLEKELPPLFGLSGASLAHVFDEILGIPKYLVMTRKDRLRQALSLVRAAQTDQWTSMDRPTDQPYYDASAITLAMRYITYYEECWDAYFTEHGISPYRVLGIGNVCQFRSRIVTR
jgi:LPS sulfotransferase NodH